MTEATKLKLPVNLNHKKYDDLRRYFGKESVQRHLRELSRESVFSHEEMQQIKKADRLAQKQSFEGNPNENGVENPNRFGGNKDQLQFYLEEDKKRRLRQLLVQARVMRQVETKKQQETLKKQALELKLKREIASKVRDFDANRKHKNSLKYVDKQRLNEHSDDETVPDSQRRSRGQSQTSTAIPSSRGRSSHSAVSKRTTTSTIKSSRPELPERSPRLPDNLKRINYSDLCGQPVPRDIGVDDFDEEFLREALEEIGHTVETEMTKIEVVAGSNRPATVVTGPYTARNASRGFDSEYITSASVPALSNISRYFQKSARNSFTPRDLETLQNVYSTKLKPSPPKQFQVKRVAFPKIRLTREKIRYPPHPAKIHMKETINTNVVLTLRYNGVPTKVVDIPEEGHRLEVVHQPGKGCTYTIFSGYVSPGESFDITSKRLPGHPFSITLFINGYADTRVSTCCEFRHKEGFKIGGNLGRFTVEKITGDRELRCFKCKITDYENMPKLKKLIVQDKFKNQPKKEVESRSSSSSRSRSSSRSSGKRKWANDEDLNKNETSGSFPVNESRSPRRSESSDSESDLSSDDDDVSGVSLNYKLILVATNLELARESNVIVTIFGSDKRLSEEFQLEKPFRRVMKMSVTQSFIGKKLGKVSKLQIETEPSEGADWFLKEVILEYGSYRTVFDCERWIGISGEQKEDFNEAKTSKMLNQKIKTDENET